MANDSDNIKKMFRDIVNGQSSVRSDLLKEIRRIDKKMDEGFKNVDIRFDKIDKRIDKLGLQLAELSDDVPTIKEFDLLEQKVEKLKHQVASA